jgi:hypothetical protein
LINRRTNIVQKLVQKNAEITLGYWGIRGLAQPIRFLLVSANIAFAEVRLGVLQDGTILNESKEDDDWDNVRSKLDMPFPKLPYLIYLANRDYAIFFVGSRVSLVDFVLYELFWQMTLMVPNLITRSSRPALFAFIKAFEKEPKIANYLQGENYIERPINMPWASFT